MPSFLSKVFPGRKKEDHGTHPSPTSPTSPTNQAQTRGRLPSLLGGKYEAVSVHSSSAPPSPIQPKELGKVNEKEKDKEKDKEKEKEKEKDGGHGGFGGIFRVRSRPMSPVRGRAVSPIREQPQSPSLLDLPGLTDVEVQRSLGTLFETDPVAETTLDESAIAGRRLTPLETLVLVKACGEYINEHGSETLGLMHPHWYSSDPAVQRKLASLFLLSLTPTPASTTTVSPSGAFENELNYTRDPHDVAAVLRWGLRHFEPSTPASTGSPSTTVHSFGLSRDWYTIFHDNERSSGYPLRAFTEKLVPLLPEEHTSLLNAILDVTSCLARHAEANGISGSKFAKFVGFWVLAVPRIEPNDDWEKFYTRWERNGRMMEHLFLARIRDESAVAPLPRRLTELVQNYPYSSSPHTDDGILTRPRFSTRVHPALLVRVDTPIANKDGPRSTLHGLALVKRALEASSETEADTSTESQDGAVGVWTRIKSLAVVPPTEEEPDPEPALQLVIADDSITLLTLASGSTTSIKPSTPAAPSVPVVRVRVPPQHKASASIDTTGTRTNGHSQSSSSATSPSSAWSPISWADFSQAGFGSTPLESTLASTLWDTDLEKTQPPSPHPGLVRRLSSKAGGAKTPRSRSVSRRNSRRARVSESDGTPLERETEEEPKKERKQVQERVKGLKLVEVDEAFVDFWSDAVTDPIASEWPPFALAQLKSVEGIEHDGKRVEWLVVEQTFSEPPPPPPPAPPVPTPAPTPAVKQDEAVPRAPKLGSPRLSVSSVTKRFTFFGRDSQAGKHKDEKDLGKKRQTGMKVGEMGEIVREEEEPSLGGQAAVKDSLDIPKATEVAKVEDKDEVTKSAKEPENIPLPPDTASQAESNTSEVKSKFVEHAETPSPAAVDAATKTPETDHDAEVAAAGVAAAGVVAVAAAVADSAIVTVDGIDNEEEAHPAPVIQEVPEEKHVHPPPVAHHEAEAEEGIVNGASPLNAAVQDVIAEAKQVEAEEAAAETPTQESVKPLEPEVAVVAEPVAEEVHPVSEAETAPEPVAEAIAVPEVVNEAEVVPAPEVEPVVTATPTVLAEVPSPPSQAEEEATPTAIPEHTPESISSELAVVEGKEPATSSALATLEEPSNVDPVEDTSAAVPEAIAVVPAAPEEPVVTEPVVEAASTIEPVVAPEDVEVVEEAEPTVAAVAAVIEEITPVPAEDVVATPAEPIDTEPAAAPSESGNIAIAEVEEGEPTVSTSTVPTPVEEPTATPVEEVGDASEEPAVIEPVIEAESVTEPDPAHSGVNIKDEPEPATVSASVAVEEPREEEIAPHEEPEDGKPVREASPVPETEPADAVADVEEVGEPTLASVSAAVEEPVEIVAPPERAGVEDKQSASPTPEPTTERNSTEAAAAPEIVASEESESTAATQPHLDEPIESTSDAPAPPEEPIVPEAAAEVESTTDPAPVTDVGQALPAPAEEPAPVPIEQPVVVPDDASVVEPDTETELDVSPAPEEPLVPEPVAEDESHADPDPTLVEVEEALPAPAEEPVAVLTDQPAVVPDEPNAIQPIIDTESVAEGEPASEPDPPVAEADINVPVPTVNSPVATEGSTVLPAEEAVAAPEEVAVVAEVESTPATEVTDTINTEPVNEAELKPEPEHAPTVTQVEDAEPTIKTEPATVAEPVNVSSEEPVPEEEPAPEEVPVEEEAVVVEPQTTDHHAGAAATEPEVIQQPAATEDLTVPAQVPTSVEAGAEEAALVEESALSADDTVPPPEAEPVPAKSDSEQEPTAIVEESGGEPAVAVATEADAEADAPALEAPGAEAPAIVEAAPVLSDDPADNVPVDEPTSATQISDSGPALEPQHDQPEIATEAVHRAAESEDTVEAEEPSASEVVDSAAVPTDAVELEAPAAEEGGIGEELPPAPASVVDSGETLGPQQALDMSEVPTKAEVAQSESEPAEASDEVVAAASPSELAADAPGPHTAQEVTEPTIVPMPADESPVPSAEPIPPADATAPEPAHDDKTSS